MYPLNSKQTIIKAVIVLSLAVILISACAGGTASPGNRMDEIDESAPSKVDSISTLFPYPPPLEKVGPVDGNLNPDSVIIDGSQVVPFDDSPSGYGNDDQHKQQHRENRTPSVIRMKIVSRLPPLYPVVMPTVTPTKRIMITAEKPTNSETRDP